MMGGLTGQITLALTPEFETSFSKIERLDKQIEEKNSDDQSSKKEIENLTKQISQISSANVELKNQTAALLAKCKEFEKVTFVFLCELLM